MAFNFKKFVTLNRGERVDQPDMQALASDSQRASMDEFVGQFIGTNMANTTGPGFIISGFNATTSGTVVTVTNGVAIAGYNDKGTPYTSAILSGGDPSRSIDIGTFADGTYTVWLRMEFRDTDFTNRVYWNPLASTPVEFARNASTRVTENWAIAIENSGPGPEWSAIWNVTKTGGSLSLADVRQFLFDGAAANSYTAIDAEWGGGNDRSSNRALNGVQSLSRALRGLQRQVQDILGGTGWWQTLTSLTAVSLQALNANKLERNGSNTITGNIHPDTDVTRSLGNGTTRFASLFGRNLVGTTVDLDVTGGTNPSVIFNSSLANTSQSVVFADSTTGLRITSGNSAGNTGTLPLHISVFSTIFNDMQMQWQGTTTSGTGANPPAAGGLPNVLTAKNTPKVWGLIFLDGAGGVSIVEGFSISNAAISVGHTQLTVTMATPMANTNYAVFVTSAETSAMMVFQAAANTTTQFVINGLTAASALVDFTTTSVILNVLAMGAQNT